MNLSEIQSAIGGPNADVPHQPEGGSNVIPLSPLGLDKAEPEDFPATPNAQQGAGSAGYLTPGAKGSASDGTVEPGNVHGYGQVGPAMLTPSQGIGALTPDPSHGRPMDGVDPAAAPVARPDTALGRDQGDGQSLNPALKWAK